MFITYPGKLDPTEIIGRVLGPDLHDAYAVAVRADFMAEADHTRVDCRPVGPDQLAHMVLDPWRQTWLPASMLNSGGSE